VERVRHGQVDVVLVSVLVLDSCRLKYYYPGVRRPGSQVLALDRPAASGRELVHHGHRHGVSAAAVPVPAQLLHRPDAGVPGQGST